MEYEVTIAYPYATLQVVAGLGLRVSSYRRCEPAPEHVSEFGRLRPDGNYTHSSRNQGADSALSHGSRFRHSRN